MKRGRKRMKKMLVHINLSAKKIENKLLRREEDKLHQQEQIEDVTRTDHFAGRGISIALQVNLKPKSRIQYFENRKLASSHYQSYTTALTVTIAVGCFLLLLNILIFAGIYHQRDRGKSKQKQIEEMVEQGGCSSSSSEAFEKAYDTRQHLQHNCNKSPYHTMSRAGSFKREPVPNYVGDYNSADKTSLAQVQMTELSLQEFNSSPPPAKRSEASDNIPEITEEKKNFNMTLKQQNMAGRLEATA
ncbi:hypothetical protein HUJ05_003368 [Dendroctonus ponderosae]|nr:hypothetical protein HUJ05_003368 [Dendroctonus ponderosae]